MKTCLTFLVGLFPVAFRRRFGPDLTAQMHLEYDRARSQGRLPALIHALATALDLVRSALAERWHPTWVAPVPAGARRIGPMHAAIESWFGHIRLGVRTLRRAPGYTIVTVTTLGLAIGAITGIFSVVDAVILNPLPYPDADRLVSIAASAPGSDRPEEFGVGLEFYFQYRDHADLLENVATYVTPTSTLRVGDRVERPPMAFVSPEFFSTLGVTPLLGRLPTPEEQDTVVVISHTLWVDWFGSDPDVIGQVHQVSASPRTIVGVMGPDFAYPAQRVVLWLPWVLDEDSVDVGRFGLPLIARMKPGVDEVQLTTELSTLARRIPERFGGSPVYVRLIEQHRPVVRPLKEWIVGWVARPLWILFGAAAIVLLVACANAANLLAVRAESRQRELAVRRAIGAQRGQLIHVQLAEAAVLAALAAALAVGLAWVGVPLLLRAAPPNLPRLGAVGLTMSTLLFAVATAALSTFVCGLGPALAASAPDLLRLRDGGRGATRRHRWRRDVLVVAQTALAVVLLVASGLLLRSFTELRRVDPGYDTSDIFTFQVAPQGDFANAQEFARRHLSFLDRLHGIPGVSSVGIVENVPLNEGTFETVFLTGDARHDQAGGTRLNVTWTAGGYFETMGIARLQGDSFTRDDHFGERGRAIISQSAAARLWPGRDPIGRRFRHQDEDGWTTVIGVVEDVKQLDFRDESEAIVYLPLAAVGPRGGVAISSPAYVLRSSRAERIAPEVRALVREAMPEAPMYRVYTMDRLAADSMVQLSFTTLTLGMASMLALMLGAIGIYGVLSYVVAERTHEIGVRMALGALATQIRGMVVTQGVRVVAIGVALGVTVAIGTTRALGGLLYGVEALDPLTFVAMGAAMLGVGWLASYLPARTASNVDPIVALRLE